MSTTKIPPGNGVKQLFQKEGRFLTGQVGINISVEVPKNSDLALALLNNTPFPRRIIKLSQIGVKIDGNPRDVKFGDGQGTVSFDGGGAFGSGLGVYEDVSELLADLDPDKKVLGELDISATGIKRFVVLNWNYNLTASVNGAMALGGGLGITFRAGGEAGGFFAVIRGFGEDPPSRDAIAKTLASWMLPCQLRSVADLEPGSWLIAEVNGQIRAKLGVQFGFEQTWLRDVNGSGLSGPIGLRVQAAAEAFLNFNSAGKYLMVVARESTDVADKILRLRLFKMSNEGLNVALHARVGVTGKFNRFLPGELDDFIAGVFGVHGAQIVEDLNEFQSWLDPTTPLPEQFAGFFSRYMTNRLTSFAGTEIERLEYARRQIAKTLAAWKSLGHGTSTVLWAEIRKDGEWVKTFENVLRLLANSPSDDALKALIAGALSDVAFFRTPFGKWLESVTAGTVLTAATSATSIQKIREAVAHTLTILNAKVLDELIQYVDEKLNIKQVENVIQQAQFDHLDPWLKRKLAAFLGRQVDLSDLEQLRETLHALIGKADEIYTAALKALTHTYRASLAVDYTRATTRTALIDVNFDFGKDSALGSLLSAAINGNMDDLLVETRTGLTLREAVLTHGQKRQSHVSLVLPYFEATLDHINESLATMRVVEENGRLFAFELNASDEVRTKNKYSSSLAITGKCYLAAGTKVHCFINDQQLSDSIRFSYRLRHFVKEMQVLHLEHQMTGLEEAYFPGSFGGPLAPEKASIHDWVRELKSIADAVENPPSSASHGAGILGNALLSLEVSLSGRAVAAWFNAPADKDDLLYGEMSRAVQRVLRRFVPFCYFQDLENYKAPSVAAQVLVYKCLPVSTAVQVRPDEVLVDQGTELFWDFLDIRDERVNERFAMIFKRPTNSAQASTVTRMSREIALVEQLLRNHPSLRRAADDYAQSELSNLINSAWMSPSTQTLLANHLLFVEAEVIKHAREAGVTMGKFYQSAATNPKHALKLLSDFGAKVTAVFHNSLSDLFQTEVATVRELSSMVFLETSRALDSGLANLIPSARFDVALLRKSAPMTVAADFLAGNPPPPEMVAIERAVVGLGS